VGTGKLSFRSLIDDMIKQLMRIVAKKIFLKILGFLGGPIGGFLGSLFGDKGGYIPAGTSKIIGEKGPELVTGPARVLSRVQTASMMHDMGIERPGMGNGTPITYNINAVDARSFKQLVAEDPEFIYNVTVAGARRLPR
jgi:hypothetical protein